MYTSKFSKHLFPQIKKSKNFSHLLKLTTIYMNKYGMTWRMDLLLCSIDQKLKRNSENIFISIMRFGAIQIKPFSVCQELPTGLHTRLELNTYSQKFKARPKNCEVESMDTTYNRETLSD